MLQDIKYILSLDNLPKNLQKLLKESEAKGWKPLLVGGCVRDALLDRMPYDFDVEVHGCFDIEDFAAFMQELFPKVSFVGKSYGVFKVSENLEVSLPRQDCKTGPKHQDFSVKILPNANFKQASKRRDLTVNSIGYDVQNETIMDPYHGRRDIENKILRCVDKDTFAEDPLRPWRVMQFASRLQMNPDSELIELSRSVVLDISGDRVYGECRKWLSAGVDLRAGWVFLIKAKLDRYIPIFQEFLHKNNHHIDDVQNALCVLQDQDIDEIDRVTLGLFIVTFLCPKLIKVLHGLSVPMAEQKRIQAIYTLWSVWSAVRSLDYDLTVQLIKVEELGMTHTTLCALADIMAVLVEEEVDGWHDCVEEWEQAREQSRPIIEGKDLLALGMKEGPYIGDLLKRCHRHQVTKAIHNRDILLKWIISTEGEG
ncbi:MAG: hypothetical protein OXC30_03735 [Alphaproteobacteria bacterium]|nr:hypothetical protein [Alphaproteobacteria bacterium]